jgi:hypothetical protein
LLQESMMVLSAWLNRLGRGLRTSSRPRRCAQTRSCRPRLEALETHQLLSTFTVVLATDAGGPGGQKVTATSGDLHYCIAQADASHSAASDTILFSTTLFATPQTITLNKANGPLVVQNSHPLTTAGPTANSVTVSGGDAVEVFDVAGGTVSISHLAIAHGNNSVGGGIYSL